MFRKIAVVAAAAAAFYACSSGSGGGLGQSGGAQEVGDAGPEAGDGLQFDGEWVSLWTRAMVEGTTRTPDNTIPYVVVPEQLFSEEFLSWDGWPIRDRRSLDVTVIDDTVVYVSLSAPRGGEGGGAGLVSSWRYWWKRGGGDWQGGELVFPQDMPPQGSRQWAGSVRYDTETGRATFYYTAVGETPVGEETVPPSEFPQGAPAAGRPPTTQEIWAASADMVVDESGVRFTNWSPHELLIAADGAIYTTQENALNDRVIYGFRDPWHFIDPDSGEEFILFTANAAYKRGPHNGVVGVAHRREDGTWEPLPPILQSAGISSQLERPHLVFRDGLIYLFFTTHNWTFDPEDLGPEGLYGFVTDSRSFRGHYVPLNGTGLVAGNPDDDIDMTYSWLVLPNGDVLSYVKDVAASEFLAVPAPIFNIAIDGTRAFVSNTLTPLGPTEVATDETTPGGPGNVDDGASPSPDGSGSGGSPSPDGSGSGSGTGEDAGSQPQSLQRGVPAPSRGGRILREGFGAARR